MFMDMVCSGKLYEEIMAQTGYKGDRDSFKTMFFRALYARFTNAVKTQEWRCFAKMFPRVAREMKLMKYSPRDTDWLKASKSYKPTALLPCILQAIEARYWFHAVCPDLSKAGIDFVTVHDCVLVKSSQSETALEVMKSAFARHRLYPAIKVETLGTTNVPKSQPLASSRVKRPRCSKYLPTTQPQGTSHEQAA